jgi:hypothetical protein
MDSKLLNLRVIMTITQEVKSSRRRVVMAITRE